VGEQDQKIPEAEMDIPVLSRAGRLIGDLRHAKRSYGASWGFILRRFFGPLRRRGLHRRGAIAEGLLDPRISEDALDLTLPKAHLMRLQNRVNPRSFTALTEEKVIFYAYCSARNLPVPRFFCFTAKPVGYSADGAPVASPGDWRTFAASLPDEFVVKPSHGAWGRGVRAFRREDGGFVDDSGGRWKAEELGRATITHPAYDSFLIQERLHDHPGLARLSGSTSLQTVRIQSWIRGDGEVTLPMAFLKVIASDGLVDNYDHGRTGNLVAYVDPSTGDLEGAVGPRTIGGLPCIHRVHPRTAVCFDGFRIPLWKEVCSLVRRAAGVFVPLRAIGWDVAITPSGPVLLEGNNYWDPPNYVAYSRRKEVMEPMRAFLRELETFSPERGR